jgi:hypothetical protein
VVRSVGGSVGLMDGGEVVGGGVGLMDGDEVVGLGVASTIVVVIVAFVDNDGGVGFFDGSEVVP